MTPLARTIQLQKALAHPMRLRIVAMLQNGPLCGCQISTVVKLAPSTVSEHLAVLRTAGLVQEEKAGRERHYHLTPEPLAAVGEWLHPFERYWRDRLRTLRDVMEEE